jgi:hypothetical protein
MLIRCIFCICLAICLTCTMMCTVMLAQEPGKSASASEVDFSAFVRELQQSPNEPGYVGLVWWIPTEYWEISAVRSGTSEDKAKQRFAPLRKYTVVAIAVGKIGIGNINWVSEAEIRDSASLRDAEGNAYQPVQKLSGDAEGLAAMLKPLFGNILGTMGQNIQFLFFSATNKMAKPIADPLAPGSFSLVLSKVIEGKDKVFEWKLPLTTLSPPKYCPVGKERVEANWKYCPWHGVKLDEPAAPSPPQK